jgi:glycerophosphoryl diester phosphodiesterase
MNVESMQIYSHRGLNLGPELTDAAFQKAAELGLHIEVDIRRTKPTETQDGKLVPGELVLLHDETLDRTTTGSGLLRDKTYAETQTLSAGKGFPKRYQNERIPRFEDFLLKYGSGGIYLDVKEDTAPDVLDLVKDYQLMEQALFSSHILGLSQEMKEREPDATVGLVVWGEHAMDQIPLIKRHGIDYICPDFDVATPELYERCHKENIAVLPWFDGDFMEWTPKMGQQIDQAVVYGAAGAIVNHPEQVLQRLTERETTFAPQHLFAQEEKFFQ